MASSNNSGISVACSCKGAGHWAYWARIAKLSEVEILLSGEEIYLHLGVKPNMNANFTPPATVSL